MNKIFFSILLLESPSSHFDLALKLLYDSRLQILRDASNESLNAHQSITVTS